jgi:tRNA threonylcarbamoyladenosine biosynthesis protein TsaE
MPEVSMKFDLPDSTATEALGRALACAWPGSTSDGALRAPEGSVGGAAAAGGAVVYLQGELGAGKTTCVRSLLRTFGAAGPVRSPTYTLVETYTLPALTCVHVDLYRLQSLSEVDELGLRDLLEPGSLLLVEWPERGAGALPGADLRLMLSYAGDARQAELAAPTALGVRWLGKLGLDSSLSSYVSHLT